MRQRIADAQTREAIDLRERARHDEVRKFAEPAARIRKVGSLTYSMYASSTTTSVCSRHRRDESRSASALEPGARRIVRIGDEHEPRALVDELRHGSEIVPERHGVAVGIRRRDARGRAGRLHGDRIDREGVLRIDRFALRRQERLGDQHEHVVRAVAERDAVGAAAVLARERLLQLETAAVRIQADLPRRLRDRVERPRPRPERILVGRELDAVADAVLALQLLEGLAGNVGRERADAGGSEVGGICMEAMALLRIPRTDTSPAPGTATTASSAHRAPCSADAGRHDRRRR